MSNDHSCGKTPRLRNPVKALLVPLTESQMAELQGLAEHGNSEGNGELWCLLGLRLWTLTIWFDHLDFEEFGIGMFFAAKPAN